MKDYVRRLLVSLEPLIADLPELERILNMRKEECENISRLLAYVNGDVHLLGIYADQNLVLSALEPLESNKNEYSASCYLIDSDDVNVTKLPQYKKAYEYLMSIIDYFKNRKSSLLTSISDLEDSCKGKRIEKKYYDLLKDNNSYIENIDEYTDFLNNHVVSDDDRMNLLIHAIENNLAVYKEKEY